MELKVQFAIPSLERVDRLTGHFMKLDRDLINRACRLGGHGFKNTILTSFAINL